MERLVLEVDSLPSAMIGSEFRLYDVELGSQGDAQPAALPVT